MGKIFNALEKYKKDRKVTARPGKLKPADYEALLQYDWATGKLDLNHPLVIQDPGTVQRLMTFRLIEADGSLTPAGKAKYAELNGPEPQKKARRPEPEPVEEWQEIPTAVDDSELKATMRPVVREKLKPTDWDVLMQYERQTRMLDVKAQPADVVRRLLDNDMIFDGGRLTPQALQLCKELEPEKIVMAENISEDTAEFDVPPLEEQPVVDVNDREDIEPEPAAAEAVKTVEEKPEPAAAEAVKTVEEKPEPAAAEAVKSVEQKPEPVTAKVVKPARVKSEPVKPVEKPPVKRSQAPKSTLPESHKEKMDKNLVSLFNPQSFEAEQFKILRSNLLYPVSGTPPRSLMITSSMPGEGKSFVAANLAISVALNINRHVLLVDCDLRRPSVHSRFGFGDVPGLRDYLADGVPLTDLLIRTSVDKLTILPGGEPPDNPSELLSSERMSEFLAEATKRYEDRLIILDSPPPALTAESSVLGRWVDGVVIVIRHGKTAQQRVAEVIDKMGKDKIIGAVMNNFEVYSSRYYGKYYGKGYGQVYGKKKK